MNFTGIACNSNHTLRNLNSAYHSWKPIKHVIDHHHIETATDYCLLIVIYNLLCGYHLSSHGICHVAKY